MCCLQEALRSFSCITLTECFCNGDGGVFCDVRAELYILIFFPMVLQPPVCQGLLIIEASRSHSDTPHSVGLLWTRDQPDAGTSGWQHTTLKETNIDASGEIRTSNPSKRAAADPRLRPRGHWDRRVLALCKLSLCSNRETRFWFSNLISYLTQPVPSFAKYSNFNTLYM
jgi:hypothetical protein